CRNQGSVARRTIRQIISNHFVKYHTTRIDAAPTKRSSARTVQRRVLISTVRDFVPAARHWRARKVLNWRHQAFLPRAPARPIRPALLAHWVLCHIGPCPRRASLNVGCGETEKNLTLIYSPANSV